MTVRLNRTAFEHAKALIAAGRFVFDERDDWSEHRPTADDENEFIDQHGYSEYGKWYLGLNEEKGEHPEGRYRSPMAISMTSTAVACCRRKAAPAI